MSYRQEQDERLGFYGCLVVVAACACWLFGSCDAHGQCAESNPVFVSKARDEYLRKLLPVDEFASNPRVLVYDQRSMPPAYQHEGGFHSPSYNIATRETEDGARGNGRGGNANIEFPWRTPGGCDGTPTHTFNWILLPPGKPVVWLESQRPIVRGWINGRPSLHERQPVIEWVFPIGTIIGEVLTMTGPDGHEYPWEMRTRERFRDDWQPDVFKPFVEREQLAAALDFLGADDPESQRLARHLRSPYVEQLRSLADRGHRTRNAFRGQASEDVLPEIRPHVAAKLLTEFEFSSAIEQPWAGRYCFAPTAAGGFHVVPVNYRGTFVGASRESCTNCHNTTLRHATDFQAHRDWYGFVRGSDEIFTFHPAEPSCISSNGGSIRPRLRYIPGVIEQFDPSRHSEADYARINR